MNFQPQVQAIALKHGIDVDMVPGAGHGRLGEYAEMTPGSDPFEEVERDLQASGVYYDWQWIDDDTENRGLWNIVNRPRGG